MKAAEQYFPVVLFVTMYKVVSSYEPMDEILKRTTISSERIWVVYSCGANEIRDFE